MLRIIGKSVDSYFITVSYKPTAVIKSRGALNFGEGERRRAYQQRLRVRRSLLVSRRVITAWRRHGHATPRPAGPARQQWRTR